MTDERNAARAEAERLAAVVKDMGYSDKARDHFVEKGMDAKDAKWAADIALPTMKASEVEVADIGTFLDEKFAKLYPTGAGSDGQPPPDSDNVPTPDASQPPDFARPSPASEGSPSIRPKSRHSSKPTTGQVSRNLTKREGSPGVPPLRYIRGNRP